LSRNVAPPKGGLNTAAVAAITDRNRRLLVVKRSEKESDPWSGHWALPGGRWQEGDETSEPR